MVAGKVEGNIYAAERVEFHKESIVQGDISYGSIAVEHGARLLGLVIQNPNSSAAANSNADAKNVIRKAQEGSCWLGNPHLGTRNFCGIARHKMIHGLYFRQE